MTEAPQRHPVTTLELFFDLVFVFTLTRLTGVLEHDLAWETVAQVVLIFVTLFWMYSGYVWLTNAVPPHTAPRRLLMFAGMAAFLVCALAAPEAFGDSALAFGVGFLFVIVVHAGLYMQSAGRNVVTFAAANLAHAVMLVGIVFTAAGAVHAIGHVGEQLDTAHAALLAGGVALYLFGTATFRRTLQIRPVAVRAIVGALALTATLAGRYVGAASELVLLVLLVVASIALEPRPRLQTSRQSV